jgi:putative nucleotidyltransferase with HDIG domain
MTGTPWVLVLLWLALILITDAAPVSLPGGGYITVSSTVDYAGILILGPVPVALAEFVATLVLQLGVRRRPVHKALFNASAFAATVMIAGWVFQVMGGVPGAPLQFPQILPPLLSMGVTYYVVNTALVSLVIALAEGRKAWRVWQVNYLWTILHMFASLPFGVALAVAFHALGIWGILLFIVPLLLARYTFKLYIETKRDLVDFAGVLAGVIDEFDPYTCQHSQRVSLFAGLLAREMGQSERGVEQAEVSGLLHDIGKIAVSQRDLVLKPGPLTLEERARVCLHADIGADIVGRVRAFKRHSPAVRFHHERMDGRGYHNIPGMEVPLTARIVMVADAFDAMTSDRVYRKAMKLEDALAELDRHSGTQFDSLVVAALNRLIDRGEIEISDESPHYEPKEFARPGLVNAGLL